MPDTFTPEQLASLKGHPPHELAFLKAETEWLTHPKTRAKQVLPREFKERGIALVMTGRGWGKTLTGGHWTRRKAGTMPGSVGHLIAPTYGDLISVMLEGPAGLMKVTPKSMIANYTKKPVEIRFVNETIIRGYSAEEPDRMRGPQCHWLWADEIAAWTYLGDMMDNVTFSTRLVYERPDGTRVQPQRVFTTTPRPLELIRELADDPKVFQVRGALYENRENLAETFIADIAKHEGTKLGDQEIYGLILDFDESAIIKKKWLRRWPKDRQLPQFEFIYISFDTALTEETYDKKTGEPDYTACTVWGVFLFEKRMNVMLLDAWRDRLGMPDLIERSLAEMKKEYGYIDPPEFKVYAGKPPTLMTVPRKPKLMIIEDIGSGKSLRQMLAKEKMPVPMFPYNPGGASKMARLNAVAHVVAGGKDRIGRVWLCESTDSTPEKPKFVSWADDFLSEVCIYTGPESTKHDDYVDSFSQAIRYFADHYISASVSDKLEKPRVSEPLRANPYG